MNADTVPPHSAFNATTGLLVFLIIVAVGTLIVSAVKAARSSRRRRESIAAVVTANGLSYVAKNDALVDEFVDDPFGKGSARRARDVVAGTLAGGRFQTFAYSYETHSQDGKGRRTTTVHRFQVTWVSLPAYFPHVRITPDRAWLRALGDIAGHDLNTESAAFNNQWRVRANDDRVAHAILTGPMIERLLHADVVERPVVFQGGRLMTFAPEASDLTDLASVVGMLHDVAALVPAFLVRDLNGPEAT